MSWPMARNCSETWSVKASRFEAGVARGFFDLLAVLVGAGEE